MFRVRFRSVALLLLCALAPLAARAWWNDDYKQRTQITLNTGDAGVAVGETLSGVAVPIRLHSGNFDFIGAKLDGSDITVVAADDKTPLRFWLEKFDGANELGVLWVQVPTVAPRSDRNTFYVYAGNAKAAATPPAPVVDAQAALTLRFADADGSVRDAAGAKLEASRTVAVEPNGLIGASARFDGSQPLRLTADAVHAAAGAPYSVAFWLRPASGGVLYAQGPLVIELAGSKLAVRLGNTRAEGGELPANAWAPVGVTVGAGKLTLYVNGARAAQVDAPAGPAIEGPIIVGEGFTGQLDELQFAPLLRSADWMQFTRAAQGADAKLVAAQLQRSGDADEGGGSHSNLGILVKNLTVDGWVVIGACILMFFVAVWVMATKAVLVQRTDRGNGAFLKAFRSAGEVLKVAGASSHPASSIARLYDAGVGQLQARRIGEPGGRALSGATISAVTAAVEADLVRENHRLNRLMVLLTIAISGGPFLGLLGTVVGVMVTFAAIAAAGDVNVNAIAPGIAAALLATVAGLAVAIPALFGYNYLAARIKNISADMQIFVDEFVTRVAEQFGDARGG